MWFLALYIFARLFWRARETLVKQPPGGVDCSGPVGCATNNVIGWLYENFVHFFFSGASISKYLQKIDDMKISK